MLKHRPTDRSHTCSPPDAFSDWTHQTVQFGTESNGYRGTGPGEQSGSVNERSSHHRVVSGKLHDAQTPANQGRRRRHTCTARQMRVVGLERTLTRVGSVLAPRVTDIVARGQVSGSDQ